MKARHVGRCYLCGGAILVGQAIQQYGPGYLHERACLLEAKRRAAIRDGRTFAGRKPSTWRR